MKALAGRVSGPVTPRQPTSAQRFIAATVHAAVMTCGATQRLRVADPHGALAIARQRPVVFAIWHNRLAFSMVIHRRIVLQGLTGRRMAALVSASRDGALLAAILEAFGVQPVRGSTSRRGPQALVELVTWAERGFDLALTPDGPRGPGYQVQPGVVGIARITGLPILPVSCNTRWRFGLKSWDRFQYPIPFGLWEVVFGPLLEVGPGDDAALETARDELERRLLAMTRD